MQIFLFKVLHLYTSYWSKNNIRNRGDVVTDPYTPIYLFSGENESPHFFFPVGRVCRSPATVGYPPSGPLRHFLERWISSTSQCYVADVIDETVIRRSVVLFPSRKECLFSSNFFSQKLFI